MVIMLRVLPLSAATVDCQNWGDGSYGGEEQAQLHWYTFFRRQRSCDLCLLHHRDSFISSSSPSSWPPNLLGPFGSGEATGSPFVATFSISKVNDSEFIHTVDTFGLSLYLSLGLPVGRVPRSSYP